MVPTVMLNGASITHVHGGNAIRNERTGAPFTHDPSGGLHTYGVTLRTSTKVKILMAIMMLAVGIFLSVKKGSIVPLLIFIAAIIWGL